MDRLFPKPITTVSITCIIVMFVFALFGISGSVHAQEGDQPAPKFGIESVNAGGSYFDLTISPGETRQVQVAVKNTGAVAGTANLYPVDIYTMVNGGMGFHLADEPASGATLWMNHEIRTITVGPDNRRVETFTITVPEDASSGQHLTSLVVEGADSHETTESGGVTFKNVTRQAIAILITVPGPIAPGIEIGSASHRVTAGRSVVSFELDNPGNVLLKTNGAFTLSDTDGTELESDAITLGSFYGGTSARAAIPLDYQLEPGEYTVSLWLEDETYGVRAESGLLTLTVPVSVAPVPAQVPATETESATAPVIETQIVGVPTWMLLVAIPATLILGIVIAFFALKRRMQPAMATTTSGTVPQVVVRENPPATAESGPVEVRRMVPPTRNNDTIDKSQ